MRRSRPSDVFSVRNPTEAQYKRQKKRLESRGQFEFPRLATAYQIQATVALNFDTYRYISIVSIHYCTLDTFATYRYFPVRLALLFLMYAKKRTRQSYKILLMLCSRLAYPLPGGWVFETPNLQCTRTYHSNTQLLDPLRPHYCPNMVVLFVASGRHP